MIYISVEKYQMLLGFLIYVILVAVVIFIWYDWSEKYRFSQDRITQKILAAYKAPINQKTTYSKVIELSIIYFDKPFSAFGKLIEPIDKYESVMKGKMSLTTDYFMVNGRYMGIEAIIDTYDQIQSGKYEKMFTEKVIFPVKTKCHPVDIGCISL